MIFGIKTKKDKRIEELERELMIAKSLDVSNHITYVNHNVRTLIARADGYFGEPVMFLQKEVVRKLSENLENFVEFEVEEGVTRAGFGQPVTHVKGKIRIVEP